MNTISRLTVVQCRVKAEEARRLALQTDNESQRLMLQHIADTWGRIAIDLEQSKPR
jgi:hypothetical protein